MRALQQKWYQKLRKSGFNDIENTSNKHFDLIKSHSTYFGRWYVPTTFDAQQEYYRRVGRFLHEHSFQTPLEQEIWKLHSEGRSLREIAFQLRTPRNRITKDRVMYTIKRYEKIMETYFLEDD